jgi:pantetheine-phosphate adenylyltransferase
MRLLFLGTGGSVGTADRHTTALYLPEHDILLDAGTNVFPLRELHGDRPLHVLMSHYHADHSIGLLFMSAGLFHGRAQTEITVHGPEWGDRFQAAFGEGSPLWPISLPFRFQQAGAKFKIGEVEITTHAVEHPSPTLAYRLRFPTDETLAYVTDTTAPGDYLDFIRGVDILVHECTFTRENQEWAPLTFHSYTDAVAQVARDAGVKQLYLTHTGALEDRLTLLSQVREGFPNTELPIEGLEYPRATSVDPRRAIFPGTFDPITVSHLDIIHTCAEMFKSLHVVVARNPAKDGRALFTAAERADLIRRCLPASLNVDVWEGLTVHYAQKVQAGRIVRGLGRAEDYTVDVRLWKTNALLAPEIQTVWVPPRAEHLDVSSSMIKEAGLFGGWEGVCDLVPEVIRDDVGKRIAERRAGS